MTQLPFIPTRDMVVFPGVVTPLYVGRTLSVSTLEKSISTKSKMLLGMQKDPFDENPSLESGIHPIGVLVNVLQVVKMPNNNIKVLVEAEERVTISKIKVLDNEYTATYKIFKTPKTKEKEIEALFRKILKLFEVYINSGVKVSGEILTTLKAIKDIDNAFNIISSNLFISSDEKQKLLSTVNLELRGFLLLDLISREIEITTLEKSLDDKVKDKMNQAQKNYYLKEKIVAIKEELGETNEDDIQELEVLIKKAKLPKKALQKVQGELKKLSKMPAYSAESSVCRNYIETVVELPWSKESKDILDIKIANEILEKDHYGLKDIKDRILDYLAVKQLNPKMKGGILCLAGPPGVGKTS
ncbi:MAG: LON peptidase substrate-binding domain-containing protein, partial [Fusobacteriaceae bacterium]